MKDFFQHIDTLGGTCYYVGGYVRDQFVRRDSPYKDIDIEVFGVELPNLISALNTFFDEVKTDVGNSFSVVKVKHKGIEYDFSLPRIEKKVGTGHKGFEVYPDPYMQPIQASERRDFTINAMMQNCITGEVLDFHGGMYDLQNRVLMPVSEKFMQDPLRILRGFQSASRFELKGDSKVWEYAEQLKTEYATLPKERIWEEWKKWAKGIRPSYGLNFLSKSGWIEFYPELNELVPCPQDARWHPEGTVFIHTGMVCDAAAMRTYGLTEDGQLILMLAALLHDVGKPATTTTNSEGRIVSPGHAAVGADMVSPFLRRIGCPLRYDLPVRTLVYHHMSLTSLTAPPTVRMKNRLLRKLIEGGTNWDMLKRLILSDKEGIGGASKGLPKFLNELDEMMNATPVEAVKPLILGRHLISALNMTPGPAFKSILDQMFEWQLDNQFTTEQEGLDILITHNWT